MIRVEFRGEDGLPEYLSRGVNRERLWYYHERIRKGINITDALKLEFLAYSNSGIKDKQFWFFTKND